MLANKVIRYVCTALLTTVAYVFIRELIGLSVLVVLTLFLCLIGVTLLTLGHKNFSPIRNTSSGIEYIRKELHQFQNKLSPHHVFLQHSLPNTSRLPVIFGRTVDCLLQQLLDYVIQDFILVYVKDYGFEPHLIMDNVKKDFWFAVQKIHKKLSKTNHIRLLAHDCIYRITWHFQKIREAKHVVCESDHLPLFTIPSHLSSSESELDYLRHVSEIFILHFLPRTYSLSPSRYFLRETLACKVLQPFIDTITDPDYFNRKVLVYIEAQKGAAVIRRKTFEHATSFEDLLKTIQKTESLETLKHMRYDIVTNLMQATKLQNLNRTRGLDPDQEKSSSNKSELNAARKLKHYIIQLTLAKTECEKRFTELDWDANYQVADNSLQKLPLKSVLEHTLGRKYLSHFLETVASQGLIDYWSAVEELRTAPRKSWHQLGTEIFYAFIRNPSSEIKIDKGTRKAMEEFLLGDRGPDVFYEVQDQVVQMLEEKYYQLFLTSDFYKNMLIEMAKEEGMSEVDGNGSLERIASMQGNHSLETTILLGDHSSYAKKKLNQLQEKLNNKVQACQALQSSLKPESRVLKFLQKEIEWLEGEKHQLETHIMRTEVWSENLGKWRAIVQSADVLDEKEPPYFVIVVHMIENEPLNEECISSGWVVSRSLTQFQELHRKLRPLCSNVCNLELPSQSFRLIFQQKIVKQAIDRSKLQIQKYLDFVLEDDKLNSSEAIYAFLSPSSEHLKQQASESPKKLNSFLTTIFKSGSGENGHKNDATFSDSKEGNLSQALHMPGSTDSIDGSKTYYFDSKHIDDDNKDAIAEPLYALMSEVFNMWGVLKYLRKTLITFVQVTYGRTINRQIYDTISWCFSEEMLHYYISLIMKSWWPGGVLAKPYPERSLEEKYETMVKAREEFVTNVPDVLITLLGNNSAKCGAQKVFDTLQHKKMNKQLVYDILEEVLKEMFAELRIHDEKN